MASPKTNTARVRAYLDLLSQMDIEGWGELLAKDSVQENPCAPEGFPGRFGSWDEIMEHHRSLPDTFESMRFEDVSIMATDDPLTVVAEFRGIIALKDGGNYDNHYVSIYEFTPDGLIRHLREYFNPLVLLESFSDTDNKLHGLEAS